MPELVDSVAKRAESRIGSWANDKWHLERLIGVGGVAAVYAARHRNGRRVAVKVLHPELGVDASIRRRFLREGYVANRVEHPGAVVVLDDAIDGDSVMLVMELLEGETLEARCRRNDGKLEPLEVLRVAGGLLAILESAHAHDILHRDITPSNIFVTKKGEIKLLDFGIARLRDSESDHTMSVPGALGTPAFMPPEQARGLWEELDARSDLWAVGAISFRALSGRSVHQGRSPSELLLSAMTRRAPALDSVVPDIPPIIAALVDRALKKQPSDRWKDAKSFREAVEEAFRELAGSPMSAAAPLTVPDAELTDPAPSMDASHADGFGTTVGITTFRSRRFVVVVAAVGAAVLGTLIFWPRSKEQPPVVFDDTARTATSILATATLAPTQSDRASQVAPLPSVGIDAGVVDAGRRRTQQRRVVGDPLGEQY